MNTTDTPRTDANSFYGPTDSTLEEKKIVHADFARQLERELSEANSDVAQMIKNHTACEKEFISAKQQRDQWQQMAGELAGCLDECTFTYPGRQREALTKFNEMKKGKV
jgi:hypothetical protein